MLHYIKIQKMHTRDTESVNMCGGQQRYRTNYYGMRKTKSNNNLDQKILVTKGIF